MNDNNDTEALKLFLIKNWNNLSECQRKILTEIGVKPES